MRYFKRFWNEHRSDGANDWGTSWWFFETDDDGQVHRQIEQYFNGQILKYSLDCIEDEQGGLASEFDLAEMSAFEIDKQEFERNWIVH